MGLAVLLFSWILTTEFAIGLFFFLSAFYYTYKVLAYPSINFPPGPKPLPIIGNLFQAPTENHEERFLEWAPQYGAFSFWSSPRARFFFFFTLCSLDCKAMSCIWRFSDNPWLFYKVYRPPGIYLIKEVLFTLIDLVLSYYRNCMPFYSSPPLFFFTN